MTETVVLDYASIDRAISRMAHEIIEANEGLDNLVILGIPTRGVVLAERLTTKILAFEKSTKTVEDLCGTLDITFFRDDKKSVKKTQPVQTHIPQQGIEGKTVILVDDVLFSGRTIRSALDAITEYGRPAYIRLATLVDRGHRELPIRPDYVGKNIPSTLAQRISVQLEETDGKDQVVIL